MLIAMMNHTRVKLPHAFYMSAWYYLDDLALGVPRGTGPFFEECQNLFFDFYYLLSKIIYNNNYILNIHYSSVDYT